MARKIALLLLAAIAGSVGAWTSLCEPSAGWPRSFADEFDGNTLNASNWKKSVNGSDPRWDGSCRHARCAADDVYLEDGSLVLRSQRRSSCFTKGYLPGCFNYSTGGVTSQDLRTFTAKEGFRLCVSAALPGGPGGADSMHGVWPAHWMMPNDESCDPDEGEIDILEMIDGNGLAQQTYHWQSSWPAANCSYPTGHLSFTDSSPLEGQWWNDFHEFAVEHTMDYLAFAVDGRVVRNVSRADATNPLFWGMPFYTILNTAVGGGWPGEPTKKTVFPVYHRIDYVRASRCAHCA